MSRVQLKMTRPSPFLLLLLHQAPYGNKRFLTVAAALGASVKHEQNSGLTERELMITSIHFHSEKCGEIRNTTQHKKSKESHSYLGNQQNVDKLTREDSSISHASGCLTIFVKSKSRKHGRRYTADISRLIFISQPKLAVIVCIDFDTETWLSNDENSMTMPSRRKKKKKENKKKQTKKEIRENRGERGKSGTGKCSFQLPLGFFAV